MEDTESSGHQRSCFLTCSSSINQSGVEFRPSVHQMIPTRLGVPEEPLTPAGRDGAAQTLSCPPDSCFKRVEDWEVFFPPQQKLFEGHVLLLPGASSAMLMAPSE